MNFDNVVAARKSVREFKNKKASWKDIIHAIDAAVQAPFAGNHMHMKFLIIEDEKTIEKLAEFANQDWISQAGIVVLACSDDTNLENLYGERGRVYSRQGAGAAIAHFLLKLTELGLSACWVGAYSDELVKQQLGIPQHIQIEAIIPVGYEQKKSARPRKKSLDGILYWEKWDQNKRPALIQEGDDPDPSSLA